MEKHKKIDTKAIEYHIAGILKALGDNPEREGLIDTPKRVAKMYEEVFEGMNYTNEEIADMFNKTFALDRLEEEFENVECKSQNGNSDMVVVKDIDIFSYCEHHLALMYDMKVTVAYIPKGTFPVVSSLNCFCSPLIFHGIFPFFPIQLFFERATIKPII